MNFQKIIAAAIGLTILAGLAMHQGETPRIGEPDASVLVGTALEKPVESTTTAESTPVQALDGKNNCDKPNVNPENVSPESDSCDPDAGDGNTPPKSQGNLTGL